MSVSDAITNAAKQQAAAEQQTRDAVNRAIVGVAPTDDVNKLLNALIAAQDGKVVQVNETVIAFDVQQFSERLSAVENKQSSQLFGVLSSNVTRGHLVFWNSDRQLQAAASTNLACANKVVGFADQSGLPTQQIRVVTHGVIENPMWNFVPNRLLFLGTSGEPTHQQVGLFSQAVGLVLTPTTVFVKIGRAVIRS